MKTLIFCATEEDKELYKAYGKGELELTFEAADLTPETVDLTRGYEAAVVLTRCAVDRDMARRLADNGIRYVLTRSAGYDHLDLEGMKEAGLKGANVPVYSPGAIAEYVCMTVLMMLRKAKRQLRMIGEGDYTLAGIRGRELRSLTVGIVGAGRIGFETLKIMGALAKRVLVYDLFEREEAKQYGTYTDLSTLYKESDIIIYHCPLTAQNYHMVNEETLKTMKDGVLLVNPARGGLWDYGAVYRQLLEGKIQAAAFDVYESEKEYLRRRILPEELKDETLAGLIRDERVIYTAHSAFYTDTAVGTMVDVTVQNLKEYQETGSCSNELIR